ncbi:MAG: tyrosine-type recombinase/integrase [Planctomycetota bacterium]
MRQLITVYVEHLAARGLAPGSLRTIRSQLDRWMIDLAAEGCLEARDVRAEDLDRILMVHRQRGLARETMRGLRTAARGFFGWLYQQGHILVDPSQDLTVGPVTDASLPPQPLCEAEVIALIDAVPTRSVVDLRNRAHLELLYGCGLRLRESLDLMLEDLDLHRRTILIRGKGGHERLLPLMAGALVALRDYLVLRRTLLRGPDRGVVFMGRRGRPVEPSPFRQWLSKHAATVLGPHRRVHPHLLRHSIAVHLLRGGADIRHVQAFLGHADLDTTKVYLRLVPGHLRRDYDEAMPALA